MPLAKVEVFEPDIVELAAFAKVLSHPARIEILKLLAHRGELAAMEIVRELPLSQPACSRHINDLQRSGLLKSRVDRSYVFYQLDYSALTRFCASMNAALHPKS